MGFFTVQQALDMQGAASETAKILSTEAAWTAGAGNNKKAMHEQVAALHCGVQHAKVLPKQTTAQKAQ